MNQPLPYLQRIRDYYQALGYGAPYRFAQLQDIPFQQPDKPLDQCRVVIITTAAQYHPDRGEQGPGAPYNGAAKFFEVYSLPSDQDPDLRISHIAIDRRYGFIRNSTVTSAAEADGGELRRLVTTDNTSSKVWADTAYRSKANEEWLASRMLTSCIHRRKPHGKPMSKATARANGKKSSVRARIEHVFAHQKMRYGLFIRTIGLARAEAKLTLANLAYNFDRLVFHERRMAAV